ncbi:MAG: DUF2804 domain-containing protein [Thermodesulfobacteriota bacterium]
MDKLVDAHGRIDFGVITEPVGCVNYMDYALKTSMGRPRSALAKKLLFKQFYFVGIDSPETSVGLAVVDLRYAANAFFYVYDKADRTLVETSRTTLPGLARIAPDPETGTAVFRSKRLSISIGPERVSATSPAARVDADLLRRETSSLRICTRTGFRGWTYTQKTAPIPVSGRLRVNGRDYPLLPDTAMAITDWTAGYLRRHTFWNWAAVATVLPDGRRFGMNLSCGVNETEATENVLWVDGVQTKVNHVKFGYNDEEKDLPWRVTSEDGKVNLSFQPFSSRSEHLNALIVASRFIQFIGAFSGYVKDDRLGRIELAGCPGWTEEHYAKW